MKLRSGTAPGGGTGTGGNSAGSQVAMSAGPSSAASSGSPASGGSPFSSELSSDNDEMDEDDEQVHGGPHGMVLPANLMALVQMLSGVRGGPQREGPATAAERTTLQQAAGAEVLLRESLALGCARIISYLRQLPVELQPEIMVAIAEEALDKESGGLEGSDQMCECARGHRGDDTLTLAFSSHDAPTTRAVCHRCGKITHAVCKPRVQPLPGGDWHSLRSAVVSVLEGSFKPCRHFHVEGPGGRSAVRHRMSGLHSFRTIVVGEWVLSGRVTYAVQLDNLRLPLALGVGCVAPRCDVNSDTAWAAGTRGWPDAWGVVVEEHSAGPDDEQQLSQIRACEQRAAVGGSGERAGAVALAEGQRRRPWWQMSLSEEELPSLQAGDTFVCTIDAGRRRFEWRVERGGATIAPPPNWRPDEGREDLYSVPLATDEGHNSFALAVALKYASDSVSVRRVG